MCRWRVECRHVTTRHAAVLQPVRCQHAAAGSTRKNYFQARIFELQVTSAGCMQSVLLGRGAVLLVGGTGFVAVNYFASKHVDQYYRDQVGWSASGCHHLVILTKWFSSTLRMRKPCCACTTTDACPPKPSRCTEPWS